MEANTDVFQQRKQRQGPDDRTDTTDYILLGRDGSTGGPNAVEDVKRRSADVGIDDSLRLHIRMERRGASG